MKTNETTIDETQMMDELFTELRAAWHAGDGARWGRAFCPDADFVNVQGLHIKGAAGIAAGHQGIFDTIYKGSTLEYSVVSAETLADGCVLGVISAVLDVPAGPLQGVMPATISAVVVETDDGWKVRAFHNTLVRDR